jgi:hypothetical protein
MFSDVFSENRAVYEIMLEYLVEPEATNDVTEWRMRVAYTISKTILKHSCECALVGKPEGGRPLGRPRRR